MHHYGGGYSDIKRQSGSWKHLFDKINNDPNIWVIGLGGLNPPSRGFGIPKSVEKEVISFYPRLVGVSYFICRKKTPFTTEWYNKLHQKLDCYLPTLKKYPAIFSRESYDRPPSKWCEDEKDPDLKSLSCPSEPTKYPIKWSGILGDIVYPIQTRYLENISNGIPEPDPNQDYT